MEKMIPILAICALPPVGYGLGRGAQWLTKILLGYLTNRPTIIRVASSCIRSSVWFGLCLGTAEVIEATYSTVPAVRSLVSLESLWALKVATVITFTFLCWTLMEPIMLLLGYGLVRNQMLHTIGLIKIWGFFFRVLASMVGSMLAPRYFFAYDVGPWLKWLSIGTVGFGTAMTFAAQDVLRPFWAALLIAAEQPFELGDWIDTGDVSGIVEEVSVRMTKIRMHDQSVSYIPNVQLLSDKITNHGAFIYKKIEYRITLPEQHAHTSSHNLSEGIAIIQSIPNISPKSNLQIESLPDDRYRWTYHLYLVREHAEKTLLKLQNALKHWKDHAQNAGMKVE